uniref:Uncharacterized protein n=1 Tax=Ananas comosus var. bracteatus TaxID=296719 RepID=A0A6V7NW80_ANACO|nr:unnamed protein product [Ananas comosus var. bracteatus]
MMPVTRSPSARADDAAHLEEAETSATSGSSEVRGLRTQLAVLTDLLAQQTAAAQRQAEVAQRQEARMKHLEDLLLLQRQLQGRLKFPHRQHPWWTSHRGRSPRAQFFTCGTGDHTCHAPSSAYLVGFGHADRPPNGQSFPWYCYLGLSGGALSTELHPVLAPPRRSRATCTPKQHGGENYINIVPSGYGHPREELDPPGPKEATPSMPLDSVLSQSSAEYRVKSGSRERRTVDPCDPKSLKLNGRGEPSNPLAHTGRGEPSIPLNHYRERRTVDPVVPIHFTCFMAYRERRTSIPLNHYRERRTVNPVVPIHFTCFMAYRERRTVDPVESLPGEENRQSP